MSEDDEISFIDRSSFMKETSVRRKKKLEAQLMYQLNEILAFNSQQPPFQMSFSSQEKNKRFSGLRDSLQIGKKRDKELYTENNFRQRSKIYEPQSADEADFERSLNKNPSKMEAKSNLNSQSIREEEIHKEWSIQKMTNEKSAGQPKIKISSRIRKNKRKTRQTMTPQILQKLKDCLKRYDSYKQDEEKYSKIQPYLQNLKKLSVHLNMSLTSIRQKYREFKADREITGGVLIRCKNIKRAYRKSIECEKKLNQLISSTSFTSIKHLKQSYQQIYGCEITYITLRRHLQKIGFTKFQERQKSSKKIDKLIKSRKKYLHQLYSMFNFHGYRQIKLLYVGQCEYSTIDFKGQQLRLQEKYQLSDSDCLFSTIALISFMEGIIFYQIKKGKSTNQDYERFFMEISKRIDGYNGQNSLIVCVNKKERTNNDQSFQTDSLKRIVKSISVAEIPFQSQELNFANIILTKIKDKLANDEDKTANDRYEKLEMMLNSYTSTTLYSDANDLKNMVKRATEGKKLMND